METRNRTAARGTQGDPDGRVSPEGSIPASTWEALAASAEFRRLITAIVVAITLGITIWAARQTRTTVQFYAAGRKIKGWQNGLAIAGDYMSAASFLGIAGLIAFNGYDGFMYSVGWLVAYLTVLLLIAEPIRNTGKYTMADVLAYRMSAGPVRSAAAISALAG